MENNGNYKVTVYIPTKNRKGLLGTAVESVRRQTYTNWELIVVDDGSTDGTSDLLREISSSDPRIKYIVNETSLGGAGARNRAIQAATGDFVTGLDDDDTFVTNRLELFVKEWEKLWRGNKKYAFLYSNLNEYIHGSMVGVVKKPGVVTYNNMFYGNAVGNQIFAPKSHYIDSGLFNEELPAWQDLEFFMRVLKRYGEARLVDEATYNFDNTPRVDRISLKKEGDIRAAYAKVKAAHHHPEPRFRQMLQMQLYARLYGIKPNMADLIELLRNGIWIEGLVTMFKARVISIR
tara:strand:+ start:39710 stop:40582 length:873 start_codon:yes stop_codon:yes gene_type:complete